MQTLNRVLRYYQVIILLLMQCVFYFTILVYEIFLDFSLRSLIWILKLSSVILHCDLCILFRKIIKVAKIRRENLTGEENSVMRVHRFVKWKETDRDDEIQWSVDSSMETVPSQFGRYFDGERGNPSDIVWKFRVSYSISNCIINKLLAFNYTGCPGLLA